MFARVRAVQEQIDFLHTALDVQTFYNARYIELKTPDVVDAGPTGAGREPHALYLPTLKAVAAAMALGQPMPWNCSALSPPSSIAAHPQ
jgi:hypothetical protein